MILEHIVFGINIVASEGDVTIEDSETFSGAKIAACFVIFKMSFIIVLIQQF